MKAGIIIVGGGIVGSSIAYHLSQLAGAGTVLLLECDHTYTYAAGQRRYPQAVQPSGKYPDGGFRPVVLSAIFRGYAGFRRILKNRSYPEKDII